MTGYCPSIKRVLNFGPFYAMPHWSFFLLTGYYRPGLGAGMNAGFILLTALIFIILIFLIALVEMVVLQLLHWGNTRQSMRASLAINIPSSLVGIVLLLLFPHPNLWRLAVAWFILVAVEGAILSRLRPQFPRYNWLVVALANLASYIILIVPAFLFRG